MRFSVSESGRWSAFLRGFSVAVLLLCALAQEARAGGFSNLDFGIRRMGMWAVTAKPDDGTAIFHNPAGLTLLEGTNFYHSQSWFISGLGFKMYDSEGTLRPEHDIEPTLSVGVIPFIAVTSDLGLEKLRLGFALYAPNAYGEAMPEDEPVRYHAIQALFVASRATLAAAYEVTDRLSIGASISLLNVYLGYERAFRADVLANPDLRFKPYDEMKDGDGTLEISGMAWSWAWDVGILFKPIDTLNIGVGFASGSEFTLKGPVTLTKPDGTKEKSTQSTYYVIPFTLRAGINWEFAPDFEIAVDVFWWHYQVLQEQRTTLSTPISGIGEFVDPKNYDNSWNWCIGMLYRPIPQLELMVGYQEDYTPIPNQTFTIDNPSRDQRGISVGVRWQISPAVRVGVAYGRNWFDLPDVQESMGTPPSNIKGHGDNDEFGLEVLWRIL